MMFKRFDKYIIVELTKAFVILNSFVLPIMFLSDLILQENFAIIPALEKMIFKYSQVLPTILFLSAVLGIRMMRRRYKDFTFISIGFQKYHLIHILAFFSVFWVLVYSNIFIPSNGYFFEQKLKITNWCIKKQDNEVFFIHEISKNKIEIWHANKNNKIQFSKGILWQNNLIINEKYHKYDHSYNFTLNNDDFFIVWNDARKLSWKGLVECQNYLMKNHLSYQEIQSTWYKLALQIPLIIAMIFLGAAFGWNDSFIFVIIICIIENWLNEMFVFMPLFYALLVNLVNVCVCFGLGLWILLK